MRRRRCVEPFTERSLQEILSLNYYYDDDDSFGQAGCRRTEPRRTYEFIRNSYEMAVFGYLAVLGGFWYKWLPSRLLAGSVGRSAGSGL